MKNVVTQALAFCDANSTRSDTQPTASRCSDGSIHKIEGGSEPCGASTSVCPANAFLQVLNVFPKKGLLKCQFDDDGLSHASVHPIYKHNQ